MEAGLMKKLFPYMLVELMKTILLACRETIFSFGQSNLYSTNAETMQRRGIYDAKLGLHAVFINQASILAKDKSSAVEKSAPGLLFSTAKDLCACATLGACALFKMCFFYK